VCVSSIGLHAQSARLVTQSCQSSANATPLLLSPDDKLLIVLNNRESCLFEVETGRLLRKFGGDGEEIFRARFSPDSRTLLLHSGRSDVSLWDLAEGRRIRSYPVGDGEIASISFDATGQVVLIAQARRVSIFDTSTGSLVRQRQLPGYPANVQGLFSGFSQDGSTLALCGVFPDNTAYVWEMASDAPVKRFRYQSQPRSPAGARLSPDGKLLALTNFAESITSSNPLAQILETWDVATGRLLWSRTGWNRSISFSGDGSLALLLDRKLQLVRTQDGQTVSEWNSHQGFSFALLSHVSGWAVGELISGEVEFVQLHAVTRAARFAGQTAQAVLSPDGRRLLASGKRDSTDHAVLYDVETGAVLHEEPGLAIAFSPDGKLAVVGNACIDIASLRVIGRTDHASRYAAFSPDRSILLWGGYQGGIVARVDPFQVVQSLPSTGQIFAAFPATSTALISQVERLESFDWNSQRVVRSMDLSPESAHAAAVLSDGSVAVAAPAGILYVLAPDFRLRFQAKVGEVSLTTIASSPDGEHLAVGNSLGQIFILDLTSGEIRSRIGATEERILSLRWPEEHNLISISGDLAITRWDAAVSLPRPIVPGIAQVEFLNLSSDGRSLLTGLSIPVRWNLDTGSETDRLRFTRPVRPPHAMASSADNSTALLSGSGLSSVSVWQPGERSRTVDLPLQRNPGIFISELAVSRDGSKAVMVEPRKTSTFLRLWSLQSSAELSNSRSGLDLVDCVAFSSDGDFLAAGGFASNGLGAVEIWSISGRALKRMRTIASQSKVSLCGVHFAPDRTTLFTGGGVTRAWNIQTGALDKELSGDSRNDFIAFAPDGSLVAITSNRGVNIFEWPQAHLVAHLPSEENVLAVALTPDRRFAFTGGVDGVVRLWSLPDGKLTASLFSFNQGGWAVVAPDGRFDTDNLDREIPLHWVMADDPFHAQPLEVYMRDYYTPRLLSRLLSGDFARPIRDVATLDRTMPRISIQAIKQSADSRHFTVEVVADAGARDLRLFRDGRLVAYRKGIWQGGGIEVSDIQIPVREAGRGPVVFTAYALNRDGVRTPVSRAAYALPPSSPSSTPKAFVVNIGVDRNRATGCDLRYAAADASALSRALTASLPGYEKHFTLLASTAASPDVASKSAIRDVLAAIAAQATPQDLFFLSFSGHGYTSSLGGYYLVPADAEGSCAGIVPGSAISADDLRDWLRPIDAGEMVMVLDACYAGASVDGNGFIPGPMGDPGLGQLAYDKRMRILAASQSTQAAGETPWLGMGFLSYALVKEGIEKNKADWQPKDGRLELKEWFTYAAQRVPLIYDALRSGKTQEFTAPVPRGIRIPGLSSLQERSVQIPALFDFAPTEGNGPRIR
jgi:WD40 repeat protein